VKKIIGLFVVASIFSYWQFCFLSTEQVIATSVFREKPDFLRYAYGTTATLIEHGSRKKKEVALTFDADMTESMQHALLAGNVATYADRRIIDLLIKNNIKATVFVTGMWMKAYPAETKMMAANYLFELSNHSYSHPSFAGDCYGLKQIPSSQFALEMEKTQQMLKAITKVENKYFRFPGGCYDQKTLDLVAKEGMITVHWDTVAYDGFNTNTEQIVANILTNTQNGSIIVMHIGGESNAPKTFEALQIITSELKEKGFAFVTISELLNQQDEVQILTYLR
jgi:peptidoglycan/xylan/chitin deacetylase (PgdA/CDA1 family)